MPLYRSSTSAGNRDITTITATVGQTVVTVPTYLVGYNELDVFLNGVFQKVASAYTESSTTSITFTESLKAGDLIDVRRTVALSSANPSYLGASSQAVDSALLGGQNGAYYLNYSNFTNKPSNNINEFTATAGQTVFTFSGFTNSDSTRLMVFVNGSKQLHSSYTKTTTNITLSEGLNAGDIVEIYYLN